MGQRVPGGHLLLCAKPCAEWSVVPRGRRSWSHPMWGGVRHRAGDRELRRKQLPSVPPTPGPLPFTSISKGCSWEQPGALF